MLTSAGTISGCGDRVPDGGVAAEPLLVHLGQHGHEGVHIVDDRHRALAFVEPMEPSGILLNGAAPGDGQGQEPVSYTHLIRLAERRLAEWRARDQKG